MPVVIRGVEIRSLLVFVVVALMGVGCGTDTLFEASAPNDQSTVETIVEGSAAEYEEPADRRPTFTFLTDEHEQVLAATTYCWIVEPPPDAGPDDEYESGGCADGADPVPLPHLGSFNDPVRFRFPHNDWSFVATMGPPDGSSGGQAVVRQVEPGLWEIELAGQVGTSEVRLSGQGPAGDAHVAFEIDVLVAGAEPAPTVDFAGPYPDIDGRDPQLPSLAALREADVLTTGLSLSINQLADDRDPSATVQVTSANGASGMIELGPHQDGVDPEGNGAFALQATELQAQELFAIGPPPYRIDLVVTINGQEHRSSFTYPDDLNLATTSFQPEFEPPLPAR